MKVKKNIFYENSATFKIFLENFNSVAALKKSYEIKKNIFIFEKIGKFSDSGMKLGQKSKNAAYKVVRLVFGFEKCMPDCTV
jgi:hypothetical protein